MDISNIPTLAWMAFVLVIFFLLKPKKARPVWFSPVKRDPLPEHLALLGALTRGNVAQTESDLTPPGFAAEWAYVEERLATRTAENATCPICHRADSKRPVMLWKNHTWPKGLIPHISQTHMAQRIGQASDEHGFYHADPGFVAAVKKAHEKATTRLLEATGRPYC